ncbi:MAG: ABC transporter permease [Actinomycetaceae bacterium]|nr:ABC transporter permease [Actinomycetaceae bacterium]
MYRKLIVGDIRSSLLVTAMTTCFVAAASMLTALAAMLATGLVGSVGSFMDQAKTPHYMQMHAGRLDTGQLEKFAEARTDVESWQTVEFLNIDGSQIEANGKTQASSTQDNGLATQSQSFDHLLDFDGRVVTPAQGEIYLPISYRDSSFAFEGDTVTIHGHPLTVAGFIRDSQMNSPLAGSKRLLVSEEDFQALRDRGEVEYLIEFRLKPGGNVSAFEAAYRDAGLPANGQALTYGQFRLVNALSDGLMIAVVLLMSALVTAIAFMCIRFTLLAKIEEDYGQIGVLKAIGIRTLDIKRLYRSKYAAIGAIGSLVGLILALALRGPLSESARTAMGASQNGGLSIAVGLLGALFVFVSVVGYVHIVLRRLGKISPALALRQAASPSGGGKARRLRLRRCRLLSTNAFLGTKDVASRPRLYATMFAVLVLSAFIMILPRNMHATLSSDGFVSYLGVGRSDMRIDIQQVEDIPDKTQQIAEALDSDEAVTKYSVLTTKNFKASTPTGVTTRLKVELGDHDAFPIEYSHGRAPHGDGEIALSSTNADDLELTLGDRIAVETASGTRDLRVSGIYSDLTNGGKTAKATFDDDGGQVMWSVIAADARDDSLLPKTIASYRKSFPYAKVSDISTYMRQTFGGTISSVSTAASVSASIAAVITLVTILLFVTMLLAKDRQPIAAMKALGFTNRDIRSQYLARCLVVLVCAMVTGAAMASVAGETVVGGAISLMGVDSFRFEVDPLASYVVAPLLLAVTVVVAASLAASRAGQIDVATNIKE